MEWLMELSDKLKERTGMENRVACAIIGEEIYIEAAFSEYNFHFLQVFTKEEIKSAKFNSMNYVMNYVVEKISKQVSIMEVGEE